MVLILIVSCILQTTFGRPILQILLLLKNHVTIIEKFVQVSFTNLLPNLKYELKSLMCLAAIKLRHL